MSRYPSNEPMSRAYTHPSAYSLRENSINGGVLESLQFSLETLQDIQLDHFQTFGNYRIVNPDGSLTTTQGMFKESERVAKTMRGVGDEVAIPTTGYQTCIITRASGGSATLLIEGWTDQGSWVALTGITSAGAAASSITGADTTVRVACAGFNQVRVRCSVWASVVVVSLKCSTAPYQPVTTSVAVTDTYGAYLYGTGATEPVTTRFGLVSTACPQQPILPTNTLLGTTNVPNWYSRFPQIFNRVRVESAGSQKVPFAQEAGTNRLLSESPRLERLLEDILLELISLNENLTNK